jgi:hypothetical protein
MDPAIIAQLAKLLMDKEGSQQGPLASFASGLSTEGLDPATASLVRGFKAPFAKDDEKREKEDAERDKEIDRLRAKINEDADEQRKRREEIFKKRVDYFKDDLDALEALGSGGDYRAIAGGLKFEDISGLGDPLKAGSKLPTRRNPMAPKGRGSKL